MNVSQLMTTDVCTVRPENGLDEAAYLMLKNDVGCVPVVDDDQRPIGMITDRDVAMASYVKGAAPHRLVVGETMTGRVFTCRDTDAVAVPHELMREHQVRRIPVTDEAGCLVGLLSLSDLSQVAVAVEKGKTKVRSDLADTMGALTRPRDEERAGRFANLPKAPRKKAPTKTTRTPVAGKKTTTRR